MCLCVRECVFEREREIGRGVEGEGGEGEEEEEDEEEKEEK